jgi:hypothetical protein
MEPSAPALPKTEVPTANETSYTSFSCAIICVFIACFSRSHIVQVVSILAVAIIFGSSIFQSNDVNGAENCEGFFYVPRKPYIGKGSTEDGLVVGFIDFPETEVISSSSNKIRVVPILYYQ